MKRNLFLILIVYFGVSLYPQNSYAQNDRLSLTFAYPIPVGDAWFANFKGIGDIKIAYTRTFVKQVNLGGVFGYSGSSYKTTTNRKTLNLYRVGLVAFTPYQIDTKNVLQPELQGGYCVLAVGDRQAKDHDVNRGWFATYLMTFKYQINEHVDLGATLGYELVKTKGNGYLSNSHELMQTIHYGLTSTIHL